MCQLKNFSALIRSVSFLFSHSILNICIHREIVFYTSRKFLYMKIFHIPCTIPNLATFSFSHSSCNLHIHFHPIHPVSPYIQPLTFILLNQRFCLLPPYESFIYCPATFSAFTYALSSAPGYLRHTQSIMADRTYP